MKLGRAGVGVLIALIISTIGAASLPHVRADRVGPSTGLRAFSPSLLAWLPPEPVFPEGTHAAEPRHPDLVLDADTGYSHLTWEEDGQVRYAVRRDGTWHLDEISWRGDSPALALDAQGRPHLVYVDISPIDAQLQIFYVQNPGDAWSLPQNVSTTAGPSTAPDLSIAVTSAIHIAWSERLDRSNRIYHACSVDGGITWSQVMPIPDAHGYSPALAASASGVIWAAWQGLYATDDTSSIWVAQWDGAEWSSPKDISEGMSGSSHLPDLLVAPDDSLQVTWEQEILPNVPVIMFCEGRPQAWSQPLMLSAGQGTQPALAYDAQGRVTAVWDAGTLVACRTQQIDGAWGGISFVGESAPGIRDVALSASARGNVDVAWSALSDEGPGAIWFATQIQSSTATPSPTYSRTPTETGTPTLTPTSTATDTMTSSTATQTPIATVPLPTQTTTPQYPYPLPTATSPIPTSPQPTVDYPYNAFVPAIAKSSDGVVSGAATGSRSRPPMAEERDTAKEHQVEAADVPYEPWQWYESDNVSASAMVSRDAAVVWLSDSEALAVWEETYPAFSLLTYSILQDGVWSSSVPFYVGESPDLAVDASGQVHLVFSNEFGGAFDVFYATWSGTQWAPPQNVSSTSGNSSQPAITVREDGVPIVVWSDTTESARRIYYGWQENGLWSTYLIHGSVQGISPDVAVSRDQRVWASWQALEPWGTYEVYAAWGDGASWQNFAILVSGGEHIDSMAPRLASTRGHGAYLVWQEDAAENATVHYSDNVLDNYWWALPETICAQRGVAERPDIVVLPSGQAYVAWEEPDDLAITSRHAGASTWLSPTLLADDGVDLASPKLAIDHNSRLLVMWSATPSEGATDIHGLQGRFDLPYNLCLARVSRPDQALARASESQ